jgi:hypothetical protein
MMGGLVAGCTASTPPVKVACAPSVSVPSETVEPGATVRVSLITCGKSDLRLTYVPTKYVYPRTDKPSVLPDNGAFQFGSVVVSGTTYDYRFPRLLQWRGVFVVAPVGSKVSGCKRACRFATAEEDVLTAANTSD